MAAAFEQAALAMIGIMTDPLAVGHGDTVTITAEAPTPDFLLLDWLNALVLEMATRRMIFGTFDVVIDGNRLVGTARGEPISRERHAPAVEIKGATLTELKVIEEAPGLWRAQCVVDV
jgi:tRNA nucleotidyltransferase (CCA-adding enzyme)